MENQMPEVSNMYTSTSISEPVISDKTSQPVVEVSKTNNILITLLSVLLLLSIVIAGFFAYQTQKLAKELTVLKTEPIIVASPTATGSASPTASSTSAQY